MSGCSAETQKSELPQRLQNDRLPCSDDSYRVSWSTPASIESCDRETASQVTRPRRGSGDTCCSGSGRESRHRHGGGPCHRGGRLGRFRWPFATSWRDAPSERHTGFHVALVNDRTGARPPCSPTCCPRPIWVGRHGSAPSAEAKRGGAPSVRSIARASPAARAAGDPRSEERAAPTGAEQTSPRGCRLHGASARKRSAEVASPANSTRPATARRGCRSRQDGGLRDGRTSRRPRVQVVRPVGAHRERRLGTDRRRVAQISSTRASTWASTSLRSSVQRSAAQHREGRLADDPREVEPGTEPLLREVEEVVALDQPKASGSGERPSRSGRSPCARRGGSSPPAAVA